ncbi:MAG: site-2 protease family protein [Pseudomonadota bacterium]
MNTAKNQDTKPSVLGPRQYSLFRLFGFEVKIDVSWLLLALLIVWTLAAGLFPTKYPDLHHQTYWWMGIAGAVGIFFSIVFHEFSHSLIARRHGMPIRGITLFIFGGVAEMEDEPPSPESEFWMAIAGPISSFLLAVFFYLVHQIAIAAGWHASIVGVSYYLGYLNMILAIFNLVPAFPLDGGRVLRAGLWKWKNDIQSATRTSSQIGAGFGLVLIILGVLGIIQGNFIAGMWWLLIGAFLRGAANASYMQLMMREVLQGEPISRFMNTQPVVVPPSTLIQFLVDDYLYKYHYKMFPVVEDSRLLGCVTVQDVKDLPREEWGRRRVENLVHPCSLENTVSPDADTTKVLMAMIRPGGSSRYMVVDDGRLMGIISMADLKAYLALKLDLEPPSR